MKPKLVIAWIGWIIGSSLLSGLVLYSLYLLVTYSLQDPIVMLALFGGICLICLFVIGFIWCFATIEDAREAKRQEESKDAESQK